jgi:hypothetical protein
MQHLIIQSPRNSRASDLILNNSQKDKVFSGCVGTVMMPTLASDPMTKLLERRHPRNRQPLFDVTLKRLGALKRRAGEKAQLMAPHTTARRSTRTNNRMFRRPEE